MHMEDSSLIKLFRSSAEKRCKCGVVLSFNEKKKKWFCRYSEWWNFYKHYV